MLLTHFQQVKWAVDNNIPFLVYAGGNGWATTFKLDQNGIIIQLDQLRDVIFNADKTEVTIGGGALISDVVNAAFDNSTLVATGKCNTVGMMGAVLGGGLGNLQGQFGLGVDELISLNIVDAYGKASTVTSSDEELWYALRGAGPNFAVVTSAVMRAHPVKNVDALQAWTGALIFRPDQLEDVIQAIDNLKFTPETALLLSLANNPAQGGQAIIAGVFYHGLEEAGRTAFKDLLDIGPVVNTTAMVPYNHWNDGADRTCIKGGRRPTLGAGLARMDPSTWRQVYDIWSELIKQPGAERSGIVMNAYPTEKIQSVPEGSSAVPWRHVKFHAAFTAFYSDSAFDTTALEYGKKIRGLWLTTDGLSRPSIGINNAFGDEDLTTLYGDCLEKLKKIKKTHDPSNRFNQWFPLA